MAAISISGWGAVSIPQSQSWDRKFGTGALTLFFLISAAGWCGLIVPGVLWGILVAGAILWIRPGRFSLPMAGGLVALFGLTILPLALLPPVSRDAMIHHLYQARLWLEAGRIVRPEWSAFFSYPYLVETFYTLAGGTFGFRVARIISLLGFLATGSVLAGYFLRKKQFRQAVLSLIVLLSIPELFRNASWSYADSFLVFFSLLAYMELIRKDGNPLLAVVWAGGASCCKYNGILVLASVCILLPFFFRNMSLKLIIASICAACFTAAWWAVPNILQWGNPFYPLLRNIFGSDLQVSLRGADYLNTNVFSTSIRGILDYILLPVRISLHGEWNNPALFDGASGPLLLCGTIIAIPLATSRKKKFALPFLYLLSAIAFSGTVIRLRYLLPGLVMLVVPATEALSALLSSGKRVIRVVSIVLIAVCVIWSANKVLDLYAIERPWELPDDETYLQENAPYYAFFQKCDRYISGSDKTLLVNLGRPFYFPGFAIFDRQRVPLGLLEMFWAGMESQEIEAELRERGITHLAMDMFLTSINLTPELDIREQEEWRKFVSHRLYPLLTVDRYVLYCFVSETE
ncbi:MAG: hypothetical protein KAQ97_01120 [Candidatus Fermentibacteraceae bacterium]|nr:hypothetical protein [Candidatus Fermentibacteraceae bacterium]